MAGRLGDISERLTLYRNTTRGIVAGVCAGLADRIGIKRIWVRGAFVAMALFDHAIPVAVLYLLLAIIMRPRAEIPVYAPPDAMRGAPYSQPNAPWPAPGANATPPSIRLNDIKTRFTAIDARLSRIEAIITSNELSLRRKFRDLGG